MSERVDKKNDSVLTWDSRLALSLPGPPIVVAILISACLISVYMSFVWLFGLTAHPMGFLVPLLIGYILMVPKYINFHNQIDRQLYWLDKPPCSDRELEIEALRFSRDVIRRSRWAGVLGVLVAFTINEVAAVLEGASPYEIYTRIHDGTVILPLILLLGLVVGRSIYFSSVSDRQIRLPDSSSVDLLHLENLYAIGRTGLRRVLVDLVMVGIAGLMGLTTVFGLWVTVPVFVFGLVIGLTVLLRPARRVRSLIREVKNRELAQLEPLLRKARDETLADEVSTQGQLTDLMAYRDRIESTAEWPFNSPTILRFGLYLFIPVGSMVGGALIERLVDGLLD